MTVHMELTHAEDEIHRVNVVRSMSSGDFARYGRWAMRNDAAIAATVNRVREVMEASGLLDEEGDRHSTAFTLRV